MGSSPELSAHEECAAATENSADHRHVQVIAGRNVRNHQSPVEEQVRQQQVVDVASVRRHVDYRVTLRHSLQPRDAVHFHPVVDLLPEPGEKPGKHPDGRKGHVRCDALDRFPCPALRLGRFQFRGGNCGANGTAAENLLGECALMGEVRTQGGHPLVSEPDTEQPGGAPDHAVGFRACQFPERNRRAVGKRR